MILLLSSCAQTTTPLSSHRFQPGSAAYNLESGTTYLGPVHDAAVSYVVSHLDSALISGPHAALWATVKTNLAQFFTDSTDFGVGDSSQWSSMLETAYTDGAVGNYSSAPWVSARCASSLNSISGVSDYTSTDSAFVQSFMGAMQTGSFSDRTDSLDNYYTAWQGDSLSDVASIPPKPGYQIAGGSLSIACFSNKYWQHSWNLLNGHTDADPCVAADPVGQADAIGAISGSAASILDDKINNRPIDWKAAEKAGAIAGAVASIGAAIVVIGSFLFDPS